MARILVVEDDEDVRTLVQRRLGAAEHHVLAVGSAEEALAAVDERGVPDVAILDIGLPGIGGFDLAPALRALDGGSTLPVIFLSANVLPQDIQDGRALGATYLTKPFVATALLKAVDDALADRLPNPW